MGTAVADLDGAPEELVEHHQSGVEELTNIFVDRWRSLYRIAMRQLENGADAEDAVQDAFLSAYTHLDRFKRQARMSTWVTTIVINSARMKLRRRPRKVHVALSDQLQAQTARNRSSSDVCIVPRPVDSNNCVRDENLTLLPTLLMLAISNLRLAKTRDFSRGGLLEYWMLFLIDYVRVPEQQWWSAQPQEPPDARGNRDFCQTTPLDAPSQVSANLLRSTFEHRARGNAHGSHASVSSIRMGNRWSLPFDTPSRLIAGSGARPS
jgi:RNA polymerase sigma factor (sigma-70 family)